jgi:hypothetical protein
LLAEAILEKRSESCVGSDVNSDFSLLLCLAIPAHACFASILELVCLMIARNKTMNFKILILATLFAGTAAHADTVYRTVDSNGKVVYSDTYSPSAAGSNPKQVSTTPYGITNSGSSNPDIQSGCKADLQKFCAQSNGNKSMDCLLDHQQEVTDACYDAMKKQLSSNPGPDDQNDAGPDNRPPPGPDNRPAAPKGAQACKQDVKKFCSNVQPGGGRIVNCLLDHQDDISDGCYDTLSKKMKQNKQ